MRAKREALNKQKEQDEAAESKRIDGRLLVFLTKAQANDTSLDYSFAGVNLGPARTQILAKILAYNSTLKALHLSRKKIGDKEGQDLARALLTNNTLRKLELESNNLQIMTARVFALALRRNKTLQYLDLEANDLTHEGQKNDGVEEMIEALRDNQTLLSLNVSNNRLDADLGTQFREMLKINRTLIEFEFSNNNFRLEDVSKIVSF